MEKYAMSTDNSHKDLSFLYNLFESLGNSGDMSTEEIKEELNADGIDSGAALKCLMDAVEQASADSKKSPLDIARNERLRNQDNVKKTFDRFKNWSRDQILAKIKELSQKGDMIPVASYRELEKQTDENLRALLEDLEILSSSDIKDSGNE